MMLTPGSPAVPVSPAPSVVTLQPLDYSATLAKLMSLGWQMVSEGPSGAQLKQPKKMMLQTKLVIIIGALCGLFTFGLSLLLVAVAVVDYAIQKDPAHFLSRDNPQLPTSGKGKVSPVFVLFFVLIMAGIIASLVL